jgi:hypothetical protein
MTLVLELLSALRWADEEVQRELALALPEPPRADSARTVGAEVAEVDARGELDRLLD